MGLGQLCKTLLIGVGPLALAACGGGDISSASSVPSATPTPKPTPTPTPTPTATAPLAPAHLGLVSSKPFAILAEANIYAVSNSQTTFVSGPTAQDAHFSYDAATNSYQASFPGFQNGTLVNPGYSGSAGQIATSSTNQVTAGSSTALQSLSVDLFVPGSSFSPYTYTSFGTWGGQTGVSATGDKIGPRGDFVYGIPTQAGDAPVTGTATYTADVRGSISSGFWVPVTGSANLAFDFAAGKLSGSMHAGLFDTFDGIIEDFGKYDFTQTVYSTGSTTFSGKFIVPGLAGADSSFDGNFTGPGAAELMARFQAPFIFNGQQGTMSGVWIGKKN